jgi:hypothetical protein
MSRLLWRNFWMTFLLAARAAVDGGFASLSSAPVERGSADMMLLLLRNAQCDQ